MDILNNFAYKIVFDLNVFSCFREDIFGLYKISYLYIGLVGFATTILVGLAASLLIGNGQHSVRVQIFDNV